LKPTIEQESIINHVGHTVVIAQPGSGKTFTLVTKIIRVLKELKEYQGVIAISYTRKASRELEKRCLQGGIEKKGTFFGTMDKFYLVEIVMPFGRHIFGRPKKEIEVIEKDHEVLKGYVSSADAENMKDNKFTSWANKNVQLLKRLYLDGYIILDAVPFLALYLL
jgi:superfamily I DNA/RNA helicase